MSFNIPHQSSREIRSSFLKFFADRGHIIVPSMAITPADDPTLLFTNSGMNQFKGVFLGDTEPVAPRVADTQKCLRVSGKHNDLEEVGRDGTHHTFFEMLGNWSFGDYYKREAIVWAWELLTEVWQIPRERLFVTVYKTDDEAAKIWVADTDCPEERVLRFEKDNFWEMGQVGPCGPCSEIHFDTGDPATQEATYRDPEKGVNGTDGRYVEIWNLVFMQHERLPNGSLRDLTAKHVDTGAGLERLCSLIQGKTSNYGTDLFEPLITQISRLTGKPYQDDDGGMGHRVIADHCRALVFAIADGVTPSNEGRGYVMRRILRRASRFAHKMGVSRPMIHELVAPLIKVMGEAFPELTKREDFIREVILAEEERFLKTLDQGLTRLDKLFASGKKKRELPGEDVFMLHDTFGFPADLTKLIAAEQGFSVDLPGFEACMEEQKTRARKAQKFDDSFTSEENWHLISKESATEFVGYDQLGGSARVQRFREQGDFVYIILDKTPFYAESGGQVGDVGVISGQDVELRVVDTFKIVDLHVHKCALISGIIRAENLAQVTTEVDGGHRQAAARHHSGTHLLHASLGKVFGQDCHQEGSHVSAARLRLDYSISRAPSSEELQQVEDMVNAEVLKNAPITTQLMSLADAKESGAAAHFGEKYGEQVRVLQMGDFSRELCGGTHCARTGDVGFFKITSESSLAAGIRRVEAVCGTAALEYVREQVALLGSAAAAAKIAPARLPDRVAELMAKSKQQNNEIQALKKNQVRLLVRELIAKQADGKLVHGHLDDRDLAAEDLQLVLDTLAEQLGDRLGLVTHASSKGLAILVAVGSAADQKLSADQLIKQVLPLVGGRGGGRRDKARGAASDASAHSAIHGPGADILRAALS